MRDRHPGTRSESSAVPSGSGVGPALSVVIASVESERSIDGCVTSVAAACAGLEAQVTVVDASTDASAERAERLGVEVVRCSPGTLVPDLWAEGIKRSTGRWVALSTGHCTVPEVWARSLIGALEGGADGAGAGLRANTGISATDRAVFHLRYGTSLHLTAGDPRTVDDVPGDNAAYVGEDLREFVAARPGRGFWEIEYHAELRARGGRLLAVPEASAGFGPAYPFGTIFRHRFVHGRHHGRWRVRDDGQPRWRVLLPAPLVPLVLLGRAARQALSESYRGPSFLTWAGPFLALATAWAAGEAVGAAGAGPLRRRGGP